MKGIKMIFNIKTSALMVTALLSLSKANAHMVCLAEPQRDTLVRIEFNTLGSMGFPSHGNVEVTNNGKKSGYKISREDVSQYYDAVMGKNYERTMVGLAAYIETNYTVRVQYVGINIEDETKLLKALRDPKRKKNPENEMYVWKGTPEGGFYETRDLVCSVMMDP